MTGESGAVRIHLAALERVLGEQAAAEQPSESVRQMLRAISGAAFRVFDDDLRSTFAEGDALEHLDLESEELRDACRAALAGKRTEIDVQRGSATFEVHVAPVVADGGTIIAGTSVALDVTEHRYVQTRMRRRTRGQVELTALSRRSASLASLPQLLQQAADAVVNTLEVDNASVHHMDDVSDHLVGVAWAGVTRALERPAPVPLTAERRTSLLGLAAGPEALDDASTRQPDGPLLARAGVASMLSALIGNADRAYGTVHAVSLTPRSWNEQEAAFLQAIANIVWSAVERFEAEESQRTAEMQDPTTGLASRGMMLERLQHALESARARRCAAAVLLIDIDHFKVINDAVGNSGGDALLRALAPRLESVARSGDTVARLQGDEFALVCEGIVSEEHARDIAERVAAAVAEPISVHGRRHVVSASIGVVVQSVGTSAEAMLRDAAAALHTAKDRGGACVELFSPGIRQRVLTRMRTESELRHALGRDQFRLHYQPFFSVPERRLLGVEALVRWEHPRRGLVSPAEFIPLAEQTGLIVDLGKWVLSTAARTVHELAEAHPSVGVLTVSVNVSARQLRTPGEQRTLFESVEQAIADAGLPPSALALELTESTLMAEDDLPVLAELKELGIQTMLDDFGTGHSSLGRLSDMPLDVLKIDRRFVSGLGGGAGREPIVAAIVAMAEALNLRVIAEGVETDPEWQALIDLGCGAAQGFALARPMPAEGLAALLGGESEARAA